LVAMDPLLDEVVEPGLADLGGRDLARIRIVGEGADKGEGARDIVIGYDKWHTQALMHIVGDLTKLCHDLLVGPAFKGPAQVHADDFAQNAGVDAFSVVGREWHRDLLSGVRRWRCTAIRCRVHTACLAAISQPVTGQNQSRATTRPSREPQDSRITNSVGSTARRYGRDSLCSSSS
jgi:hypothetical protein